jgi:UPF0716 family protein affecting phage T7 exclusion
VPFTDLKAMLIGILLLVGGIALLVGDVLIPGFLWGASLGGIWVLLAPFGAILLGVLLVFASLANKRGKPKTRKRKEPPPPPPPPS